MRLMLILILIILVMSAFFIGYGLGSENQITSSAIKHSYDDNALQPEYGDGTGMKIVTISGL